MFYWTLGEQGRLFILGILYHIFRRDLDVSAPHTTLRYSIPYVYEGRLHTLRNSYPELHPFLCHGWCSSSTDHDRRASTYTIHALAPIHTAVR